MRRYCAPLVATMLLAMVGRAEADEWRVARHDAARTAENKGRFAASPPEPFWRAYMGGRPSDPVLRFGLGGPSGIVFASGGRILGKDVVTQATTWKSDLVGNTRIAGFADLDGDGAREVVVFTDTRVRVLEEDTGAILWSTDPNEFHAPSAVRLLDLDGDGRTDLAVDECSSCASAGTLTAAAYAFSASFSQVKQLWALPSDGFNAGYHSGTDSYVDVDGDGAFELILPGFNTVSVLRGADASLLVDLPTVSGLTKPYPQSSALAADIGGDPSPELVIVQGSGAVSDSSGPPGLYVFHIDGAGNAEHRISATAGLFDAEMVTNADLVRDLDGDGVSELVLSYRSTDTGGTWITRIYAGDSGEVALEIADARYEGALDLDPIPGAEVVLATPEGLTISHYTGGALEPIGAPLPGVRALSVGDDALRLRGPIYRRLASVTRGGEPTELIVGAPTDPSALSDLSFAGAFLDARAVTVGDDVAVGASFVPEEGEITDVFVADFATRPYAQVAVGLSTGSVMVLDSKLAPTNGTTWIGGPPKGTRVGGGRQASTGAVGGPLVANDSGGPFVVLPGRPEGMRVGDARDASWILPPKERWIGKNMGSASIIDLGPLGLAVVGVEDDDLVARRADSGDELGRFALGPGTPWGTPLPLRMAGAAAPRVGIDWRIEGVQIVQHIVDFVSPSSFAGDPLPYGGFFASGVGDLDGDGTDAWFSMNGPLEVRDPSGLLTTVSAVNAGYSIPMVAPFVGAPMNLLLQGTAQPPRLLDGALGVVWQTTMPEAIGGMGGARAVCAGSTRFITPSVRSPYVRAFDGATGQPVAEVVLAQGKVFASMEVVDAFGYTPGLLSNLTTIDHDGQPLVLAGSTDGFLYALSACDLSPVWSVDLGAPVAEPIVADDDADGFEEIVVGTADGYVVGVDWPGLPPPEPVFVEVPSGNPQAAIPGEPVTVTWTFVEKATGYEIALVDPDDEPLWSPAYKALPDLSLVVDLTGALAGRPYRFAVRAVGANGIHSRDAFSPPVIFRDDIPPTLKLRVIPRGTALDVTLMAHDDLALDAYVLRYRLHDDGPLLPIEDGPLTGTDAEVLVRWEPPILAYGRALTLVADVYDSGGNVVSRTERVSVNMDFSGGAVTRYVVVGCDCGLAARDDASSFLGILVGVLGLSGVFRRRRARAPGDGLDREAPSR